VIYPLTGIGSVVITILLAACGGGATVTVHPSSSSTEPPNDSSKPSASTSWTLAGAVVEGSELQLDPDFPISLTTSPGLIRGQATCNNYTMTYAVRGGLLTDNSLAYSARSCGMERDQLDERYFAALQLIDNLNETQTQLVLSGPAIALTYRMANPLFPEELLDTWLVMQDAQPRPTGSTVSPARLIIRTDGSLTIESFCRRYTGTYELRGDLFVIGTFEAEGACPPELVWQDRILSSALGDEFRIEVRGTTVIVLARDGQRLHFVLDG
jgi:heat shock protein HslJ